MTSANQRAFRHLFDGSVEQYDPWDASHRTAGPQYPGTTMTSVFPPFLVWPALSDLASDPGYLHTVPIPEHTCFSPDDLVEIAADLGFTVEAHENVQQALAVVPANERVLIFGSLYLAGAVLAVNNQVPS